MKPSTPDAVANLAYCELLITCQVGGCRGLFQPTLDERATDPVEEWAATMAERARQAGWSVSVDGRVLCPGHVGPERPTVTPHSTDELNAYIDQCHAQGLSIVETIKAVRLKFSIGLREAKEVVAARPCWNEIARASEPLQREAIRIVSGEADHELVEMIERFLRGEDVSMAAANALEVALGDHADGDEAIEDAALMLASYRLGGGDFLYDEDAMKKPLAKAMERLRTRREHP
ncbi:hypothetical protein [Mitsuaria sp. 7]|uniref:hypothetical protein n=1 Tax=Mitsuaria sp. 7 TaxID=1658665 RepID=UPI0007DE0745|nr:hypothetical protein [Mitsuaria sp. 7]ANH68025.1 hypothetical protein ABE85_11380 [Mitsuaria sp. 7]